MEETEKALVELLQTDSSRVIGQMAANEILAAPHLMHTALALAIEADPPMNWRAARAVEIAVEEEPLFLKDIEPVVLSVLGSLPEKGLRGFLKMYKKPKTKLSPSAIDHLLPICFDLLEKNACSTAVKAYATQILGKIAKKEPDIIPELTHILEFLIDVDETAYVRTAKNTMKNLQKVRKVR